MARKNEEENIKTKEKPNWLLRITVAVILIPCIIIAIVLVTSLDHKGTPVVGSRFDGELVNEITDDQVSEVEDALKDIPNTESVSVNLKSATLRITLNCDDDISKADLKEAAKEAYRRTVKILPVKTYFTNIENSDDTITKMYDLEVNAYNTIDEDATVKKLHIVIAKNAPAEKRTISWPSSVKDEDVREAVEGDD